MDTWRLYLEQWVTMDWGYNDLTVGDIIEASLWFASDGMAVTNEKQKRVERVHDRLRRYRVVGEIIAVWEHHWQIDFGLRAVAAESLPTGATRGSHVSGELDLGIDYPGTDWREYRWQIEAITKETAPLIPLDDEEFMRQYPQFRVPDRSRRSFVEIERTDGYRDGLSRETDTMYLLHCHLLDADASKSVR